VTHRHRRWRSLRAHTRLRGQQIDGKPIGWVTQIEPIWHGAPHNRLRPDARSCRNEYVAHVHIYTLG